MTFVIPATLAAEVAAHPERFRPEMPGQGWGLVLAGEGRGAAVAYDESSLPWPRTRAEAWARMGSAGDAGSPRPAEGDRVLAITRAGDAAVMEVDSPYGTDGGVLGIDDEGLWELYHWVLLPPELPATEEGAGGGPAGRLHADVMAERIDGELVSRVWKMPDAGAIGVEAEQQDHHRFDASCAWCTTYRADSRQAIIRAVIEALDPDDFPPTQWAYDQACAALHRAKAEKVRAGDALRRLVYMASSLSPDDVRRIAREGLGKA